MEKETQAEIKKSGGMTKYAIIIAVLIIIAVGVYSTVKSYQSKPSEENQEMMDSTGLNDDSMMNEDEEKKAQMTTEQTKQVQMGEDTSTKKKVFDLTGGNFYFLPNKFTVNQGDEVTIKLTSKKGMHDFAIDEFKAKTVVASEGKTAETTFVASKAGAFEFYCSVGNHKAMGMVGILEVK